ncbi:MAG TPA: hypothetical protein VMZ29_08550 [Candidatus Bathyarchaeia archaeon]|nr:hypothetical protein [Candidatus Bathyarchaeia archaeon]
MSTEKPLVRKQGDEYNLPVFDPSIKISLIHEEVLYTLLVFFLTSGHPKLDCVVDDLIWVLDLSPNTIGRALKKLKQFGLISYYRVGRYRTVELLLENDFLKSLLARLFGLLGVRSPGTKLGSKMLGFYPIKNVANIRAYLRSETKRINSLLDDQQELVDWLAKIAKLEQYARTTQSIDEEDDFNPLLQFIDQLSCALQVQKSQQSHSLTPQELKEVISEVLANFVEIPPQKDEVVSKVYNTMKID